MEKIKSPSLRKHSINAKRTHREGFGVGKQKFISPLPLIHSHANFFLQNGITAGGEKRILYSVSSTNMELLRSSFLQISLADIVYSNPYCFMD
jgi:hypothetical protein